MIHNRPFEPILGLILGAMEGGGGGNHHHCFGPCSSHVLLSLPLFYSYSPTGVLFLASNRSVEISDGGISLFYYFIILSSFFMWWKIIPFSIYKERHLNVLANNTAMHRFHQDTVSSGKNIVPDSLESCSPEREKPHRVAKIPVCLFDLGFTTKR